MRQVRLLELIARRNAVGWLSGDYVTTIRGSGLVFHEARKYTAGESARLIDWNMTARLGEPYVRVHQEERQRDVVVAVDVSPSMHTGFQSKTKLEVAVELAASLAVSAVEGGDRIGSLLFADRVLAESPPREGRKHLFRVLAELLRWTGPPDEGVSETDPRVALHALSQARRSRAVVFLISDFVDHDVPEDLRYVSRQHDLTLLHVYDPVEYAVDAPVRFRGYSPEGEPSPRVTAPGIDSHAATRSDIEKAARRHGVGLERFATDAPVRVGLDRLFHRKRRELAR